MLVEVLSLVLILTVLGTQMGLVLVVDLLNGELVCGDQLGNHSLETVDGVVSLADSSVSAVVWLAISRWWHISTLYQTFSSVLSFEHHAVVAKVWEFRDGNEVGIVPKTSF